MCSSFWYQEVKRGLQRIEDPKYKERVGETTPERTQRK